jgi:hypothetical protein
MEIASPTLWPDHPAYALSCEEALDLPARDLFDRAIQACWSPRVSEAFDNWCRGTDPDN